MTDEQKCIITDLRNKGFSYAQISEQTSISRNTIKSFCRRNNIKTAEQTETKQNSLLCRKQCGKELHPLLGKKTPKFCSTKCRTKWWNSHQEAVNRKAIYSFTCAGCGKRFTAYGNNGRKYCSHSCYITARFGGRGDE